MVSLLILSILLLVGCSNPGIVQISPDTYMPYREDHAGIFGSGSALKAGVIRDANQFAKKKGKVVIPISSQYKPVGYRPADWASFEYQFRVVSKDDPEYRRTSLIQRPDLVTDEHIDIDIQNENQEPKSGYSKLIQLDDLRKKGIITEDEFEAEKKEILSEN